MTRCLLDEVGPVKGELLGQLGTDGTVRTRIGEEQTQLAEDCNGEMERG